MSAASKTTDSFLQSAAWEQFQAEYGYATHRIGEVLHSERRNRLARYLVASRCRLDRNWADTVSRELPTLRANSCFIRYEPIDEVSYRQLISVAAAHHLKLQIQFGIQPKQTLLLGISKSDETILSGMKPKHRYNLRLAERSGVQATFTPLTGSVSDHALFERFWTLHDATAKRQSFRTHPKAYFEAMVRSLAPFGMLHLGFATYDGLDLATVLLLRYGETATYLHGGSSEGKRELMAPYLLHGKAFGYARSLGCTTYDFWGTDAGKIAGSDQSASGTRWIAKRDRSSYGTTRFKLGFGGEIIHYPGCFDLVLQPFCYSLYQTVARIRRLLSRSDGAFR